MPQRSLVAQQHQQRITATGPAVEVPADLIDLSIGDPDLTTNEVIIDAAAADAKAGHTHYTATQGDPELIAELRRLWREDYGHEPAVDEVQVTTSGCHGMFLALQAVLDPGDEVIVPEPGFFVYPQQIRQAQGEPVFVSLTESDDFQLTIDALERVRTPRTRALIINTPNNPTGTCQRRSTLTAVVEWAREHDVILLADEIYTIYSYAEPYRPLATLPGAAERTLTVQSFSKDYVMTGWRIGSVVGPADVLAVMRALNDSIVFSAPALSQRAALHALRHRHELQPPLSALYRNRVRVATELANALPGMHATPPEGTFYLWVNITGTGLSSAEVTRRLYEDVHVRVIPGPAFGPSGEGFLRFAATCSEDNIREAFARMAQLDIFAASR